MKKLAIVALTTALFTGCATQTYQLAPVSQEKPVYNKMQPFFVSGIGQEQELNAKAKNLCGGVENIAKIQTKQTFLNGLLGNISYGIYTPRQVLVYCK